MESTQSAKPKRAIKKFPPHQIQAMGREHRMGKTLREISNRWQVPYRTLLTFKKKDFFLGQDDQSVNALKEELSLPDFDESKAFLNRYEVRELLRVCDLVEDVLADVDRKIRSGTCSEKEAVGRAWFLVDWMDHTYKEILELCGMFAEERGLPSAADAMPVVVTERIQNLMRFFNEMERRFRSAKSSCA